MLALDGPNERFYDWYEHDALVNMRETVLVAAERLVPLASRSFRLPLELEGKAMTRDGSEFCFAPQHDGHVWL